MKIFRLFIPLFILLLSVALQAQPLFEITALEGTAKVQRSGKQKWEKLSGGAKLGDNDIIETYFQSRLNLKFGAGGVAIFGSNTRTLLALAHKENAGRKNLEASFSVFTGGVFVKTTTRTHLSVFTTNAVAETDSGSLAVIVDSKTGESGILVLGGTTGVRNISQQKGKDLTVGLTTIVLPGREPSPPLYIAFRHVAVLKHFFGDKYIADQLQASAITPSDDRSASSRISLSEGMTQENKKSDATFYKRLFDLNKIYGSILDDRLANGQPYAPITRPPLPADHPYSVTVSSGAGMAGGATVQEYQVVPQFHVPYIDAAIKIPFVQNYRSQWFYSYNSGYEVLDKIQHITVGSVEDSLYCTAGTLDGITIGSGLVVDRFCNRDNNRLFHPFGVAGRADISGTVKIDAFFADVLDPTLGGVHVSYEPSLYYFSAGYYMDLNQYTQRTATGDFRYTRNEPRSPAAPLFPDTSKVKADVGIYELGMGIDIAQTYDLSVRLQCEFAQKRAAGMNDGFMIKAPSLFFVWPRYSARGGLLIESGRLIYGEFNEFYLSRRSFYKYEQGSPSPTDTLLTYNTSLWSRRQALSFFGGFGANPVKGLDVSFDLTQNFLNRNAMAVWGVPDSIADSMRVNSPLDFSLELRLAMNHDLFRYIDYAEVHVRQLHGGLYPQKGALFSSWNTELGFSVCSARFLYDLSLECGGRLYYLDMGPYPDGIIGADDRVLELFAGIRWDFL